MPDIEPEPIDIAKEFASTMANPNSAVYQAFSEFTKKEYSHENIQFLDAVREYSSTRGQLSETQRKQYITAIREKYIVKSAPSQVNLNSANFGNFEKDFATNPMPDDILKNSSIEIMKLIQSDSFGRFAADKTFLPAKQADEKTLMKIEKRAMRIKTVVNVIKTIGRILSYPFRKIKAFFTKPKKTTPKVNSESAVVKQKTKVSSTNTQKKSAVLHNQLTSLKTRAVAQSNTGPKEATEALVTQKEKQEQQQPRLREQVRIQQTVTPVLTEAQQQAKTEALQHLAKVERNEASGPLLDKLNSAIKDGGKMSQIALHTTLIAIQQATEKAHPELADSCKKCFPPSPAVRNT